MSVHGLVWVPELKVLSSEKIQVCSRRFILAHDVTYLLDAVLGPAEATEEELQAASLPTLLDNGNVFSRSQVLTASP